MIAVFNELGGDAGSVEASVFDEDPISDDPRGNGEIYDAELVSEEVRATDLVGVALKIFDPLVQDGGLELGGLRVEEAKITRDDELVDEITPDPGLSGLIWIDWSQMGFIARINVFEEFENDVRVVKGFTLIGESGN